MENTLQHVAHHNEDDKSIFGFWLYILTDCILFSCFFATFAVLHNNVYGNVSMRDITNLPYVFLETIILLGSSFTYGLAILNLYKNNLKNLIRWIAITFVLGWLFVAMELREFTNLYLDGHSWQASAALTSFFSLVGLHGLHVTIGLIFMLVLMLQLSMFGINPTMKRRLAYLGIFWAFLDIIWIFVFTIVYLMGAI